MGSHLPDIADLPTPHMFVEFAHIYADSIFGEEQDLSLTVMKEYLDRESSADSLVVAAILIDDLHVEDNTLDVNEFIRCILRRGLAPDHVVFEGKLGPVADAIIARLPSDSLHWMTFRKSNKQVLTYTAPNGVQIGLQSVIEGQSEHTCALLSAAWSLCRAGVYEFPEESIVRLTEAPTYGDKIVSVLHSKYGPVEAKVLELIRAGGYDVVTPRMEHVFFG
jgi:hypothetical protein